MYFKIKTVLIFLTEDFTVMPPHFPGCRIFKTETESLFTLGTMLSRIDCSFLVGSLRTLLIADGRDERATS